MRRLQFLILLGVGACGNSSNDAVSSFDSPGRMVFAPAPAPDPLIPDDAPSPLVFVMNQDDASVTILDANADAPVDPDPKLSNPRTRITGEETDRAVELLEMNEGREAWLVVNRFPGSESLPEESEIVEDAPEGRIIRINTQARPLIANSDRPTPLPSIGLMKTVERTLAMPGGETALAILGDAKGNRRVARIDAESGSVDEVGPEPPALVDWFITPAPVAFEDGSASPVIYALHPNRFTIDMLRADLLASQGWDAATLGTMSMPSPEGEEPFEVRIQSIAFSPDGTTGWAIDAVAPRLYLLSATGTPFLNSIIETEAPILDSLLGLSLSAEHTIEGVDGPLGLVTTREGRLYAFNGANGDFLDLDDDPATVSDLTAFQTVDSPPQTGRPMLTVEISDPSKVRTQTYSIVFDDSTDTDPDQPDAPDGFRIIGSSTGEEEFRWTDPTEPFEYDRFGLRLSITGDWTYQDGEFWQFTTRGAITSLVLNSLLPQRLFAAPNQKVYLANTLSNTVDVIRLDTFDGEPVTKPSQIRVSKRIP